MNNATLHRPDEAAARWPVIRRQAVVDGDGRVIGYDLRLGHLDAATEPAAAGLLGAVWADVGLHALVGRHRAYVTGPAAILDHAGELRLAPEQVVLEVCEQPVAPPLLATVSRLVRQGFHIAVGAWALAPGGDALIALAQTVRVSFNFGTQDVRRLTTRRDELHAHGITLLSADINTRSEYEECRRLGFDAFHGPFLVEPEDRPARGTPTARVGTLSEVLRTGGPTAFDELERIIVQDAGLAHRFLRLAGSAFFSPRRPVQSVRHALARLGAETTRRWVMLLLLAGLSDAAGDSPAAHLLGLGLHRARLCMVLAGQTGDADPDAAFTCGLLSVLPALLERSMDSLLGELSLDPRLTRALLDHEGGEGRLLAALIAYENGARRGAEGQAPLQEAIRRIYATCLLWAEETRAQL
jgi:EAL and modified HD-GYP domain-containing signal transduction protein